MEEEKKLGKNEVADMFKYSSTVKLDRDVELSKIRQKVGPNVFWFESDVNKILFKRRKEEAEKKNSESNITIYDPVGKFRPFLNNNILFCRESDKYIYRKSFELNEWSECSENPFNDLGVERTNQIQDIYMKMLNDGRTSFLITEKERKMGCVPPIYTKYDKIKSYILSDPNFSVNKLEQFTNDPDTPCYKFFDLNKIVLGEHIHWDTWGKQFLEDDWEVYKAFVYSIFVARNKSRQMLWLYDSGESGKSITSETIGKFGGDHFMSPVKVSQITDKFWGSYFDRYRLIYFDDCESPVAMSLPSIKTVSAGNSFMVDKKGNPNPYSIEANTKILFTANCPPVVVGDVAGISRAVIIKIQDPLPEDKKYMMDLGKPSLEENLLSEMPAFLTTCKISYDKLCLNDCDIVLSERQKQTVRDFVADDTTIAHLIFKSFFTWGGELSKVDLQDCIEKFREVSGIKEIKYDKILNLFHMNGVKTGEYEQKEGILLQKYVGVQINKSRCSVKDGFVTVKKALGENYDRSKGLDDILNEE